MKLWLHCHFISTNINQYHNKTWSNHTQPVSYCPAVHFTHTPLARYVLAGHEQVESTVHTWSILQIAQYGYERYPPAWVHMFQLTVIEGHCAPMQMNWSLLSSIVVRVGFCTAKPVSMTKFMSPPRENVFCWVAMKYGLVMTKYPSLTN